MFIPEVNGSIISNAPSGSRLKGAYKNSKKRKMPNGGTLPSRYTSNPRDPRLLKFNDSMSAYNYGEDRYRSIKKIMDSARSPKNADFRKNYNIKSDTVSLTKLDAYRGPNGYLMNPYQNSYESYIQKPLTLTEKIFGNDRQDYKVNFKNNEIVPGSHLNNRSGDDMFIGYARFKKPVAPIYYKVNTKPTPSKKSILTKVSQPIYNKPEIIPDVVQTPLPVTPIEPPVKKIGYNKPVIQQFNYMSNENKAKALQKYGSVSDIPYQGVDINQLKDGGRLRKAKDGMVNSQKRQMPNGGVTSGPETSTPSSPDRMQPVYIKANTRVGSKEYTKRGTTADREMNTLANSASKVSNFFGNMFSKIVGNNPQLAAGVATTAKGVNRVAQKVGDVSKEAMFNNYRPVSYPSIPEAIGGLFGNSASPSRDQEGDYSIGEEAWRTALGLPTKSKYLTPSKYKPSNSEDPNTEYYSLNNVYDPQKLINAYMDKTKGKPGKSVRMKSLAPFVSNPALNSEDLPFSETDPVQQFKLSQGTDEKGDYVSMYDTYDFNMPLMDKVVYGSNRKPYDFYDRFYYKKDASGKPVYMKQKNGGKVDHSDDKEMVDGIASILRRVESKSNRLKLANQLSKQFNREKVKYDLSSFLAKSKVKK